MRISVSKFDRGFESFSSYLACLSFRMGRFVDGYGYCFDWWGNGKGERSEGREGRYELARLWKVENAGDKCLSKPERRGKSPKQKKWSSDLSFKHFLQLVPLSGKDWLQIVVTAYFLFLRGYHLIIYVRSWRGKIADRTRHNPRK